MNKKSLANKSKELSFLLRHDTEYNWNGKAWRNVQDLIDNHNFSLELIEELVKTDEKNRYELSNDKTQIRARQGHSINVDVEYKEATPPDVLYHGTATRFLDSIKKDGIKSMTRQYVQLSADINTATEVGKRHGVPYIINIDTKRMIADGIKFYLSTNNVWLVKEVKPEYFI